MRRLTDRYSLVVHPYLAHCPSGQDGEFMSSSDRHAVLALLVRLHRAKAARPPADNFEVPGRAALLAAMRSTGEPWQEGPYGTRSRDLLARHATDLAALLAAFDELAGRVRARGGRMVITHGGPDVGNVLKTPAGLVLVDWESAMLAPPERDLWALAECDPGLLDAYNAATGTAIDTDAVALYRMWFDLAEISLTSAGSAAATTTRPMPPRAGGTCFSSCGPRSAGPTCWLARMEAAPSLARFVPRGVPRPAPGPASLRRAVARRLW